MKRFWPRALQILVKRGFHAPRRVFYAPRNALYAPRRVHFAPRRRLFEVRGVLSEARGVFYEARNAQLWASVPHFSLLPRGNREPNEFSPALKNALDAYPKIRANRGFDERFWSRLDAKRAHRRTFRGQIEAFFEIQIAGVAVWRLLGSSLAGSAFPTLILLFCLAAPAKTQPVAPLAALWATPFNLRRFWEEDAWKTPSRAVVPFLPFDPNFFDGGEKCSNFLVA